MWAFSSRAAAVSAAGRLLPSAGEGWQCGRSSVRLQAGGMCTPAGQLLLCRMVVAQHFALCPYCLYIFAAWSNDKLGYCWGRVTVHRCVAVLEGW
jgi:hypothetical protein